MSVEGNPGERITDEILVKNQTLSDVRFTMEVLDLVAGAGSSTAFDFVAIGDAPRGAGAWIAPPDPASFAIAAGAERAVPLELDIPADAGAGGWYAAVLFVAEDPDPGANVPIDVEQPVPVLVTVSGDYERDLRVSLEPEHRWMWRGGRQAWTVELRNEGDVHEVLAERVRVDGILGGAQSQVLPPAILLPGEVRRQRARFEVRDAPDLLGANVRVERDVGSARTATARPVIVLPWWLVVLLALGAAIIAWRFRARSRSRDEAWDDAEDEGSWDPSAPAG